MRTGLLENCLSCAYKTLAQDPKPLIVPVCTFLVALWIYFWALLSQPRGTPLRLQSPYKTRTRLYTRLRTRLWGARSILEYSLLALGGRAGYALYYLCWRCRAINPTPSHPPSDKKESNHLYRTLHKTCRTRPTNYPYQTRTRLSAQDPSESCANKAGLVRTRIFFSKI